MAPGRRSRQATPAPVPATPGPYHTRSRGAVPPIESKPAIAANLNTNYGANAGRATSPPKQIVRTDDVPQAQAIQQEQQTVEVPRQQERQREREEGENRPVGAPGRKKRAERQPTPALVEPDVPLVSVEPVEPVGRIEPAKRVRRVEPTLVTEKPAPAKPVGRAKSVEVPVPGDVPVDEPDHPLSNPAAKPTRKKMLKEMTPPILEADEPDHTGTKSRVVNTPNIGRISVSEPPRSGRASSIASAVQFFINPGQLKALIFETEGPPSRLHRHGRKSHKNTDVGLSSFRNPLLWIMNYLLRLWNLFTATHLGYVFQMLTLLALFVLAVLFGSAAWSATTANVSAALGAAPSPISRLGNWQLPTVKFDPYMPPSRKDEGAGFGSLRRTAAQIDHLQDRLSSVETDVQRLAVNLDRAASSAAASSPPPPPMAAPDTRPRRVNFFALGGHARVDPHLTSPSARGDPRPRSATARIFDALLGAPARHTRLNAPAMALAPWHDRGDAWCAAPVARGAVAPNLDAADDPPPGRGRAQLAVLLPQAVAPTALVVEHIPAAATLDPGATPRDLELWVPIADAGVRERVARAALDVVPRDPAERRRRRADGGGSAEEFGTDRALGAEWVRVGRWRFDIASAAPAQGFAVPLDLAALGVAAEEVVVRATSSWGDSGGHVCLYNLKLHGTLATKEGATSTVAE